MLGQRGLDEWKKRWHGVSFQRASESAVQEAGDACKKRAGWLLNLKFSHFTEVELTAWPNKIAVITEPPAAQAQAALKINK